MDSQFPDFQLVRETDLPQVRAFAREFVHQPSGARLIHLETADPENVFALAFATPPDASHGVPHILEHAVLAGSERFPVREPFFELVKSSPAGFINAMTSDVWTIYPIATTLEKDFFNLADVYCDATFHPLLTQETFEREGHHLELEESGNLESPLVRSGIVYNEMKGAYSNTEMVLAWRLKNQLFPGGPLGVDSGGDPSVIPQLTWEGLRAFYRQFYAPGNCTLFLYGDIPLEKQLAYWGEKLTKATTEKQPSLANRPAYEKWSEPRTFEATFGIEPGADSANQTFLSLRWKCGDGLDRFDEVAWTVLTRLLAGHDAAPLKKALIDSKLGADVFALGVEDVESELTFHVALKGSEPERASAFLDLVVRQLESIAARGFSEEEIETALRQTAYETLEVASLFPLHLAMDAARYATCGADPLDVTRSREMLERVREAAKDEAFFPNLLRERLLENPHRLLTTFRPDETHAAREEKREKDELAQLKSTLDESQLRAIDERATALNEAQNEPNSPEALATLPRLQKGDLPSAPREIPTNLVEVAGFPTLRNDVFSNGVVYLHAAVDVRGLPPHLWKFLPRYADAFDKMGAAGHSWETVAARRAAVTGGLYGRPNAKLDVNGAPVVDFRFALKTLDGDLSAALDLFADLLWQLEPGDRARLQEAQTQAAAGLRDDLVNNAVSTAMMSASQNQSPVGWLNYLWNSPLKLEWLRHLTGDFAANADELMAGIVETRDFLLQRERWTWSFTGSDAAFRTFESKIGEWNGRMRSASLSSTKQIVRGNGRFDGAVSLPKNLGLAAPLDVQFCARVFAAPAREVQPLVDLGLDLMRFDYFLPEVRLKGNAYGGGCSLSSESGTTTYFSYRDPRLSETLRVFDETQNWARAQNWTSDDLERALLGNVADAVPAIRPASATSTALTRLRRGETPEMRAEIYSRKLGATPEQVKAALVEHLDESQGATAVAASRLALEKANVERAANGLDALEIQEMLVEGV